MLDPWQRAGVTHEEWVAARLRVAALMRAVEQVCAAGIMTPDLGGKATTAEVTRAVCEAVRGMNR